MQAHAFILNIKNENLTDEIINKQVDIVFNEANTKFVEKLIILVGNKFKKVYIRR